MTKWKGQDVKRVIELAIAMSIILGAVGVFLIRLAKVDYIRRSDPNGKKKNDHSTE